MATETANPHARGDQPLPRSTTGRSGHNQIDHLVWICPELSEGIPRIEQGLGVRPQTGGRHPGIGTHNALVNLDDHRYLEILAPDPEQSELTSFGRLVRDVKQPRLATWAARTDDLDRLAEAAADAGLRPGPKLALSRERPDGSRLSWRLMQIGGHDLGGLIPFFIEWGHGGDGQRVHACDALADQGCRFVRLTLGSPEPERLGRLLNALGLGDSPPSRAASPEAPPNRAWPTLVRTEEDSWLEATLAGPDTQWILR